MSGGIAFEGNIFSDTHADFYLNNNKNIDFDERALLGLKKTLEELLFGAHTVVNLGDNSGIYSRDIYESVELNEENNSYVSILGNHDARKLNINELIKSDVDKFYEEKLEQISLRKIERTKYGLFGDAKKEFEPVRVNGLESNFRIYSTTIDTDEGKVGVIFRHYPFHFNRKKELDIAYNLIEDEKLSALYLVAGHWHHQNYISIYSKQKNFEHSEENVPITGIVLPPFTIGRPDKNVSGEPRFLNYNDICFYASIYHMKILNDGSLVLNQRYYKNKSVKERNFGELKLDSLENNSLERHIAWGELIGVA